MKLKEKLKQCQGSKQALLATNFYNFETLHAVLDAAKVAKKPLILQLTESSINYMGLETSVAMARTAIQAAGVEAWIHLDHGPSFELAERCLKAGVDSVMIDGSELPFEENVALTRRVVQAARSFGANVEAELGYVAKLGQSSERAEYTRADDARRFVEETGVDALAIAIGTAHGFYKSEPKLDFDRLSEIRAARPACLVLHGSSGVPEDQIRRSVSLGICKVNLATEIKNLFMNELKRLLSTTNEIDLRKVFPPAMDAVSKLVQEKILLVSGD